MEISIPSHTLEELIVPLIVLVVTVFIVFMGLRHRRRIKKGLNDLKAMSPEELQRAAYETYFKGESGRSWWWKPLLVVGFLGISTIFYRIYQKVPSMSWEDWEEAWLFLLIINLPWIATAIRALTIRHMAKMMRSNLRNDDKQPEPIPVTPEKCSGEPLDFELKLIFKFSDSKLTRKQITLDENVFGCSPRSFLYLYDFRSLYTYPSSTRSYLPYWLAEYGPVFRMKSPQEVSLWQLLNLSIPINYYREVAINAAWVRQFLARSDTRPRTKSRAKQPWGHYPECSFITMDSAWQEAILVLLHHAYYLVIDARGFTTEAPGLIWEIEAAAELFSTDRLIVLADETTYMPDLEHHLQKGWNRRRSTAGLIDGPIHVLRSGVDQKSLIQRIGDEDDISTHYFTVDSLVKAGVLRLPL